MKYFSVGEITRLGLLKNHFGKPYQHKATVSKIVSRLKFTAKKTRHGMGKFVSQAEIDRYNKRWK